MCDRCRAVLKAVSEQRCFSGEDIDHICGEPATVHISLPGGGMTFACDEHKPSYYNSHFIKTHPISTACGLPDAEWVDGDGSEPGRCEVTGLDEMLKAVSAGQVPPDA